MTDDPLANTDDETVLAEAEAAAADLKPEPIPDAADLPDDVRDGEAGG